MFGMLNATSCRNHGALRKSFKRIYMLFKKTRTSQETKGLQNLKVCKALHIQAITWSYLLDIHGLVWFGPTGFGSFPQTSKE